MGQIGQHIANQSPEFDPRNYGYKKLGDLVRATQLLTLMNDVPQIRQEYRFMCGTSERNNQQLLFSAAIVPNGTEETGKRTLSVPATTYLMLLFY